MYKDFWEAAKQKTKTSKKVGKVMNYQLKLASKDTKMGLEHEEKKFKFMLN